MAQTRDVDSRAKIDPTDSKVSILIKCVRSTRTSVAWRVVLRDVSIDLAFIPMHGKGSIIEVFATRNEVNSSRDYYQQSHIALPAKMRRGKLKLYSGLRT